jgi:secreted trypsin-like serine protease
MVALEIATKTTVVEITLIAIPALMGSTIITTMARVTLVPDEEEGVAEDVVSVVVEAEDVVEGEATATRRQAAMCNTVTATITNETARIRPATITIKMARRNASISRTRSSWNPGRALHQLKRQ